MLYRSGKGIFRIRLYFRRSEVRVRNSVLGAFRKIEKSGCWIRHVCLSVYPSAWYSSDTTERILMKFLFEYFSKMCRERVNFIKI
jgi:hypothetical protein